MVLKSAEAFQLREPGVPYLVDFDFKKDDIRSENACLWNNNVENTIY